MSRTGADAQWSAHTGVIPVPHALYRSRGGPSAPNLYRGPAFCLLSIIIDMASSLSAICRLLCTQLPALFQEGRTYKDSVAPSALREAVLDPHPPAPPAKSTHYSQALSALGHHSPTAATLQKPDLRRGAVMGAPEPLCHTAGPATEDMGTCSGPQMPQWCAIFVFIHAT